MDGIEILELGHPGLDELRAPDGKLYFYDLGGTRHPSFSVGGNLVHNSSILKAYDGKVRNQIIGAFAQTPFKLACTATPAPNDHMELGNHAEFLGVMTRAEMLATFFVHDGGETQKWRVKGHAERAFWRWLCEWAVMVTRPSDLGYTDDGFDLPPLHIEEHVIPAGPSQRPSAGLLLDARAPRASTLTEQRQARRESLQARVARAAELASASADPWILWCDLNDESTALAKAVPGAVEIRGADAAEDKEQRLRDFAEGRARVLVTKPSIAGFGLNWQHCAHMAFVGLSHSYEALFQAVRRCWRFGQVRPVHVHIITSEVEGAVLENVRRKEADHARMVAEMAEAMREMQRENVQSTIRQAAPYITRAAMEVPAWLA